MSPWVFLSIAVGKIFHNSIGPAHMGSREVRSMSRKSGESVVVKRIGSHLTMHVGFHGERVRAKPQLRSTIIAPITQPILPTT